MRSLFLFSVCCCAGCATWRSGPQPTWSAAPAMQPGGGSVGSLQPQPEPATTPSVQSSPTENALTLSRPTSPPTGTSSPVTPARTPVFVEPAPLPAASSPAVVAPQPASPAPTIPDPNAALPTDVDPKHQRVAASAAVEGKLPWKAVGQSSGGRPIEMLQLGRGEKHLVLLGSLFGNERDAVEFVEAVAALLQREPQRFAEFSIVVVRSPNPDGLAEGTLTNHRGVTLNRNFPSSNFFTQRTSETGLTEASEIETQTLLHLCDDFRPDRVVHVRAGQSQRALVLANAQAADGLRIRIDRQLMDGGEFEAYKAGSLEEYVTERLQTELLLLSLPANAASWRAEVGRFVAVMIGPPAASIRPASQSPESIPATFTPPVTVNGSVAGRTQAPDLFAPYTGPAGAPAQSLTPASQAAAPRGLKGYVEMLPPPPEFAAESNGRDSRYFELPPPE